jgi:hypothetical protein
MAMFAAIVAIIDMAGAINSQQIFNSPPPDSYYESGSKAVDQEVLSLIAAIPPKGLGGFNGMEAALSGPALCAEINRIIKDNTILYPSLALYTFRPSDSK